MRFGLLLLVLLSISTPARAEWQVKPFLGVTFGGGMTLVDLEQSAGKPNVALGVSTALLGEIFGVEADLGHAPGFFQSGNADLVLRSSVTTLTGNAIVAMPRRMTEYTLRPYFVGGMGRVWASTATALGGLPFSVNLTAIDLGAGVTGFISRRVGVSWDVRHFRTIGGRDEGFSVGPEQLSFWRANMALAIRY
jgi:hypothetical protein